MDEDDVGEGDDIDDLDGGVDEDEEEEEEDDGIENLDDDNEADFWNKLMHFMYKYY